MSLRGVESGGEDARELLREMQERAFAERSSIIEAAHERVREIEAACDGECSRLEREAAKALEAEIERERGRRLGEVRMAMRARILEAKRRGLDEVFDAAAARLREETGGPDYEEAIARRIREGLRVLGAGARVEVRESDLAACRRVLEGLDCTVIGREAPRGTVMLAASGGGRTIDNSFLTRLERCKRLAGAEIARTLFTSVDSCADDPGATDG